MTDISNAPSATKLALGNGQYFAAGRAVAELSAVVAAAATQQGFGGGDSKWK